MPSGKLEMFLKINAQIRQRHFAFFSQKLLTGGHLEIMLQ